MQDHLGPCNHDDRQSPFHDLRCCQWTADEVDLVLCMNPESHIGIDIVYDIVYDIEDAQIPGSLATRY